MVKRDKTFFVIAYDIKNNKRRRKIVKILLKFGGRINLSVFECMLDKNQLAEISTEISKIINAKEDQVAFYPLCVNCFSKIVYLPCVKRDAKFTITF